MRFISPEREGSRDTEYTSTGGGRFAATGTFFCRGRHGHTEEKQCTVQVPPEKDNGTYLIQVSLSMLSAPGGDFDEDDTVFADIFEIDNDWRKVPYLTWEWEEKKNHDFIPVIQGDGGHWGHHFGELGYWSGRPYFSTEKDLRDKGMNYHFGVNRSNMGTSSMVAQVASSVGFRLSITGDDWAAATYLVLEL